MHTNHTTEPITATTTATATARNRVRDLRPGRRIARGAAALALAASAAFGATAITAGAAGAWTPAPDGPLGGHWTPQLPAEPLPTLPPLPRFPRVTLPDSAFQPVLPDTPLVPVTPVGPVDDGGGAGTDTPGTGSIRPIDPDSVIGPVFPDELPCGGEECPPESELPDGPEDTGFPPIVESDDCLPTTPASWGAEAGTIVVSGPCDETTTTVPGDLGYPDSEGLVDPEGLGYPDGEGLDEAPPAPEDLEPVRAESATGSLAFTGSELALPIAGAGLLGAGGLLAGISVLARRARSGRS